MARSVLLLPMFPKTMVQGPCRGNPLSKIELTHYSENKKQSQNWEPVVNATAKSRRQ